MKAFVNPQSHFVRHTGGLCSKDLAELSDAELAAYLEKSGFAEEKKKYRIREGYVLRQIAGECTIVPVSAQAGAFANTVMSPNEAAAFLWNAFQTPCTKQDAVVRALEEFDGPPEKIRQDVEMFVMESLQMQILEEVI